MNPIIAIGILAFIIWLYSDYVRTPITKDNEDIEDPTDSYLN